MLSSRKEAILKSIVERYINRAVPVPSQDIVQNNELSVSSATVRNEMAFLEHEGFRYEFSRGALHGQLLEAHVEITPVAEVRP